MSQEKYKVQENPAYDADAVHEDDVHLELAPAPSAAPRPVPVHPSAPKPAPKTAEEELAAAVREVLESIHAAARERERAFLRELIQILEDLVRDLSAAGQSKK